MSTNTQTIKQWNRLIPFAGLLLALGLILSFTAVKSHPAPSISEGVLRGRVADAARYEAMAQYFAAKKAGELANARTAEPGP